MALDWSFPAQPAGHFDTQFFDLEEPGTDLVTSLEHSDLLGGIMAVMQEDGLQSGPDSSLEPWMGLGCTCGISSIACSEHDNLTGPYSPSHVATADQCYHATSGLRSDNTTQSYGHTEMLHPVTKQPDPYSTEEQQKLPKPKKARVSPLSAKTKRILDDHFAIDPYPKRRDIEGLANSTGLRAKSVMTWFTNARARKRVKRGKSTLRPRDVSSDKPSHSHVILTKGCNTLT
jgi:hypothetical protein